MIIDTIENFDFYFHIEGFEGFIESLTTETASGRHEIDGDDVYAMVSRYRTRERSECAFESHREYADIQFVLSGTEFIEAAHVETLTERTPYDPARDVAFYETPAGPVSRVVLSPGVFTVLFPHDAHMPQVMAAGWPEDVVKVVVKVRIDLFAPEDWQESDTV